jgi:hypothetical protein
MTTMAALTPEDADAMSDGDIGDIGRLALVNKGLAIFWENPKVAEIQELIEQEIAERRRQNPNGWTTLATMIRSALDELPEQTDSKKVLH